jgi:hypothetical protein
VTENQSPDSSIPLLKSNVEQLAKVRRQLEGMFRELRLIQDVIMVCCGVRESVSSDLDNEVEHVLRRCGSDRMFSVLKALTEIIERFGGTTEMSAVRQEKSHERQDGEASAATDAQGGSCWTPTEQRRYRKRQAVTTRRRGDMRAGTVVILGQPMHRHRIDSRRSAAASRSIETARGGRLGVFDGRVRGRWGATCMIS